MSLCVIPNKDEANYMQVGKILWWDSKDKNGIIKTGDGKKYYFDFSVLKIIQLDRIKARALVTFEVNSKITSCLCACDVRFPPAKQLKSIQKKFTLDQQLELNDMAGAA